MAISENWANLLEPGLRKIFYTQVEALAADSRIPSLFSVQTSSKSQEHDQGIGGFDLAPHEVGVILRLKALLVRTAPHAGQARLHVQVINLNPFDIVVRRGPLGHGPQQGGDGALFAGAAVEHENFHGSPGEQFSKAPLQSRS